MIKVIEESIITTESKSDDAMRFISKELSKIEDQGFANVLRKLVFLGKIDWSKVGVIIKTYMPEANI